MIDACIVGGGVSALVFALEFRKRYPETNIAILERESQLGGRLATERFHGFRVPLGGSMIRGGDIRVKKLCGGLGMEVLPVDKSSYLTSPEEEFNNRMIRKIQEEGERILREGKEDPSVQTFLSENFSGDEIQTFINNLIYRDFLSSSLREFLRYYPPEDLLQPEGSREGLFYAKGGYGTLIDRLEKKIEEDDHIQVYRETTAEEVEIQSKKTWIVKTSGGDLQTSLVIWATGWSGVRALPEHSRNLIKEYLAPVPFIRIAGFSEASKLKGGIVCGGELGKVFPLMKNVFQLAYTESTWAETLYRELKGMSKKEAMGYLQTLLEKNVPQSVRGDLHIDDILVKFWEGGIHQFIKSPSEEIMGEIQKPFFGFYMIGEMVARENKGWTEGALQTVEDFFENRSFQMVRQD